MREILETMVEQLEKRLTSMSKEELEAEWESITHDNFYNRWVEKLHTLSVEDRNTLIEKVVNKYKSDAYIKREIGMGYEPRNSLYTILQKYAERYGEDVPFDGEFAVSTKVIDNTWRVILYIGQGSFIRVEKHN